MSWKFYTNDGSLKTVDDITGAAGTDENAIHDNVAGEINSITEKASPANTDVILIEDSSSSYIKKKIQIVNLPSSTGGVATIKEDGQNVVTSADTLDFIDSNVEDLTGGDAAVYQNLPGVCEGRLTLETGVPVSTTDQLAKTTLYFTPYIGNKISLYDGTRWKKWTFSELSISVPASTGVNYDVFVYNNSGTLALELTTWTNDTTRSVALVRQDGAYVKSGVTTRRYIGTFRTTSVSGQCEDSTKSRLVWNYYNRVNKQLFCQDSTDSWTYSTAAWRATNNSTTLGTNRVDCIIGVDEDSISATNYALAINSTGGVAVSSGVGIDSTSTNSAQTHGNGLGSTFTVPIIATYLGVLSVGYHYIQRLEYGTATGTTTWYGDAGTVFIKTGMTATIRG